MNATHYTEQQIAAAARKIARKALKLAQTDKAAAERMVQEAAANVQALRDAGRVR